MPELPEVETVRRQLAPRVEGRRLAELEISDARWCQPLPPEEFADAVVKRRIEALRRRGKYLIWELEDEVFMLVHLRMTGNLVYDAEPPVQYERVRFALDDGHEVRFVDPRRFGTGELLLGGPALDAFLGARLGVEPFDLEYDAAYLRTLARGVRAPIKAFLIDQRRIAGVGNIYADEALFGAGIHPLREAGKLTGAQWTTLADTVKEALQSGIDASGATIDDFRDLDGARGSFQDRFQVHLREGEPCPRCGRTIKKMVAAGRGTYVCEHCQPRPRRRRRPAAGADSGGER